MANFAVSPNYRAKPNLKDLADLNLSQGDILYYDGSNLTKLPAGTAGQFLKTQGPGANPIWDDVSATVTSLNNIGDVTISSPADNEVLAYDSGTGEWINQTPAEAGLAEASHTHTKSDITDTPWDWSDVSKTGSSINDLDDVSISSPAVGQILKCDGSDWVNSSAIFIDSNDYAVGIGTTDPVEMLTVKGRIAVGVEGHYNYLRIERPSSDEASINDTGYGTSIHLWTTSSGGSPNQYQLYLHSSGRVGINTVPASEQLEVRGNILLIKTGTADDTTQYPSYDLKLKGSSWDSANSQAVDKTFLLRAIGETDSSRLGILNNSETEVLTIKESGNVGIGTTEPSEKLEVNGNIKASGAIIGSLSGILKGSSGTISGGAELNDLSDVNASSPSDGDVLAYNSSTQKWENKAAAGGGAWKLVKYSSATAPSITLSGLNFTRGKIFKIIFIMGRTDTTYGSPYLRFNGDSNSKYDYLCRYMTTAGDWTYNKDTNASSIKLHPSTTANLHGEILCSVMEARQSSWVEVELVWKANVGVTATSGGGAYKENLWSSSVHSVTLYSGTSSNKRWRVWILELQTS